MAILVIMTKRVVSVKQCHDDDGTLPCIKFKTVCSLQNVSTSLIHLGSIDFICISWAECKRWLLWIGQWLTHFLHEQSILEMSMIENTNLDCSLTVRCNKYIRLLKKKWVVNRAIHCVSHQGHEDKEQFEAKLTPSGRALQHTALTNSLVSSSFLSLSRTLFTVSNLNVSSVLESPL